MEEIAQQTTTVEATTNEVTATAKRGKKTKRNVPHAQIHVFASFNNTIVTLTDASGAVLAATSAGACGFRGSKKGTAYAAQVAAEKVASTAKQIFGVRKADVFVKGVGQGRDTAARALMSQDISIESITDKTPVAHGGVRPRKSRKG
ncbi:30S ribosomal protein S11 [Candidatus Saccharibacteria bacterium]|nr:30S ribosomal protein S11 [Candidatus Saccharibacteria bacterium]MCB9821535.1 30S ribosomal protein S11 [Candidatus Nomurabacteria bacterium]